MGRYFKIYCAIVRASLMETLMFRSHFWLSFCARTLWFLLFLALYGVIYRQVPTIGDWTQEKALLLMGTYQLLEVVAFTFLVGGFQNLHLLIRTGRLELLLVRPVDGQFLVSLGRFSVISLFSVLPPLALIVVMLSRIGYGPNLLELASFLLIFFLALLVVYSLWFATLMVLFWVIEIWGLHELFLSIFRFFQFPSDLYTGPVGFFLGTIIPLGLTVTVPARVLMGVFSWSGFFYLVFAALFCFALSRFLWLEGLKRYTGAGG